VEFANHEEHLMEFTPTARSLEIKDRVVDFMDKHVYPVNKHYQDIAHSDRRNDPDALAFVDDLRAKAKELGLWNLFFPHLREDEPGTGLKTPTAISSTVSSSFREVRPACRF
jgi:acyl-CoA dehydrogenase